MQNTVLQVNHQMNLSAEKSTYGSAMADKRKHTCTPEIVFDISMLFSTLDWAVPAGWRISTAASPSLWLEEVLLLLRVDTPQPCFA
jgi:hypothetical protein